MEQWRPPLTLRNPTEAAVDFSYGDGAGITQVVPLSRALQVRKDFAKLRSWVRAGFPSCGDGHKLTRQRSRCCSQGGGWEGAMRGIQDEVEGEMTGLEREPGPVLRALIAMLTTFRLPLQDTAGINGMGQACDRIGRSHIEPALPPAVSLFMLSNS